MRLVVACLLLFAFTANTGSAATQSNHQAALDPVATAIAGQPVEVRCWVDKNDPDADPEAWGYVFPLVPVIYLDPRPCAGALALQTGAMLPLWQLALGALTLTHEAYHLKVTVPYWRRVDEAQTECRAVKRAPQTLTELGASKSLADSVWPWVLAEHFKISSLHAPGEPPPYDYPSCRVPGMEWWN